MFKAEEAVLEFCPLIDRHLVFALSKFAAFFAPILSRFCGRRGGVRSMSLLLNSEIDKHSLSISHFVGGKSPKPLFACL